MTVKKSKTKPAEIKVKIKAKGSPLQPLAPFQGTMNLSESVNNYYSRPSVYKTVWDEYCQIHPDSGFNAPTPNDVIRFVSYNLEYNLTRGER